jgi:peptidoglycan/LPS O-acetylase OafA/YrhL
MTALRYRPDIDGLRAVAVLGVVIYHAFPWVIPGGFIGVDIFFVISGYLISGILYKGHLQGNFSPSSFFLEFYARRIRRLFPALITMLVITLAYGWLILLPDEFRQLGKHVAAGTLFIQNIVFWQESGYFDTAANLKPLLHLWSLAVEEQFYIFFPPILLLIWKRKWPLATIMGVLLVVSMAGNLWMSVHARSADFFLTPYRAWEFLGGSLLAWWHYDKGHQHSEGEEVPVYREALSWIGVILLGVGMTFIHKGEPYPGWRAIIPVAGTLLLMEGGRSAWVNRKILSNPAVVWIGLISYPLYLFHWPALAFVHIVKGESTKPGYIIAALGVALLLTVLTYYFIEKKVRRNKSLKTLTRLLCGFVFVGVVGLLISRGLVKPANNNRALINAASMALHDNGIQDGFTTYPDTHYGKILRLGGSGLQTIFLGDSHMQQYAPRVRRLLEDSGKKDRGAIFTAAPASVPVDEIINPNWNNGKDLMYSFWNEINQNPNIDRVVICARWGSVFSPSSLCEYKGLKLSDPNSLEIVMGKLKEEVKAIHDRGKKVYIILDIPTGDELSPRNLCLRSFASSSTNLKNSLRIDDFLKADNKIRQKLIEISKETGAQVIDPLPYLSQGNECITTNEDGPIRCDDSHLRPQFMNKHGVWIDQTVVH